MKMNEKEINDLKSMILKFLDAFVDAAAEKDEKTVMMPLLNLNIDYEKLNDNKEEITNLITDLKNNYKKDGYILDKCIISNDIRNIHNPALPAILFSATAVKLEDDKA